MLIRYKSSKNIDFILILQQTEFRYPLVLKNHVSYLRFVTPIHLPCKSYVTPIFSHSLERTYNGFITEVERT